MVVLLTVCLAATTDLSAQEPCAETTIPVSGQVYQIARVCQLQAISTITATTPTAYFQLTQDIEAIQTRNWDGEKGFRSIKNFTGVFDGGGYRISNLFIDRPEEYDVGLFSDLRGGAVVKNLVLSNASVKGRGQLVVLWAT